MIKYMATTNNNVVPGLYVHKTLGVTSRETRSTLCYLVQPQCPYFGRRFSFGDADHPIVFDPFALFGFEPRKPGRFQ